MAGIYQKNKDVFNRLYVILLSGNKEAIVKFTKWETETITALNTTMSERAESFQDILTAPLREDYERYLKNPRQYAEPTPKSKKAKKMKGSSIDGKHKRASNMPAENVASGAAARRRETKTLRESRLAR